MDYYDGNTVTALWNYAQHYAMTDNSFDTTFGPSTPGALNLISGQTHGVLAWSHRDHRPAGRDPGHHAGLAGQQRCGHLNGDPDPAYDDCSDNNHTSTNPLAAATGRNVGDLLNARGVTWGWFQGGFRPDHADRRRPGLPVCGATHTNIGGAASSTTARTTTRSSTTRRRRTRTTSRRRPRR